MQVGGYYNSMFNVSCGKSIHLACSTMMLCSSGVDNNVLISCAKETLAFCSKRCFNKNNTFSVASSAVATMIKKKQILWKKDNGFRRDSDIILLDWMTSHGNYNCFGGGNNHSGNSKIKIAGNVANLLTKEGVHHQTAKDVAGRIWAWEQLFHDTYDWTKNTGEGIKEIDPTSFHACVLKRFPYFFELEEIMSDCAGVQPLLTNEDLSDKGKLEEEKLTDEDNSNLIQEDTYFSEELDNMITVGVKRKMPLRSTDNFLSPLPPTKGKDDGASLSLALSKGNKSKPSASKIPVLKCSRTPVVNETQ